VASGRLRWTALLFLSARRHTNPISQPVNAMTTYRYNRISLQSRPGRTELNLTINVIVGHYYLRIDNAEGYVLIAVYLFIYLYACYSHN